MTNQERYNGWPNYETWCVYTWLTNEEGTYSYCRELIREVMANSAEEAKTFTVADRLKELIEEMDPIAGNGTMFSDLLGAAISRVDFDEIAEALLSADVS